MAAANVNVQELDLSTRVPSFPGVTGAIVLPALKGPTDELTLITSDTQLLSIFTPDEKVDVGMSLGFYSALAYLEKSNSLYVARAHNGALYGGLALKTYTSAYSNVANTAGVADISAYEFDGMPDAPAVAQEASLTFSQSGSFYDIAGVARHVVLDSADGLHYFYVTVSDGSNTQTDPAVVDATGHEVSVLAADTAAQVAGKVQAVIDAVAGFAASVTGAVVSVENDEAGVAAAPLVVNSFAAAAVVVLGSAEVNQIDEAVALFGNSPGAYNNDIGVRIVTDPAIVKEPNAFVIRVYKSGNTASPVEEHVVSRVPGALDGFGQNMFIEDRLQGSNYIRGLSNPAVPSNVLPKAQASVLFMAGGSNGAAVSDSHMLQALEKFENPDEVYFTVLMDGGWATPAYAVAADQICVSRQDSVSVISTPIAAEADANYITALLDYRNSDLNLSSSHSALYTPHVKIQDKFNDRVLFVAPDGYAAGAISASASNFEIWFPSAGHTRGRVNVLDVRRRFSQGELNALADAQINPLRFAPGRGIRIWGQSTLLSTPSKLQELNIRLLLITVEPAVKEGLENFLFELNDDSTRARAAGVVNSFMEDIQARRGVSQFRVICDSTNNSPQAIAAGQMVLDLYMIPTGSVKEIKARIIITNEGVDFSTLAV